MTYFAQLFGAFCLAGVFAPAGGVCLVQPCPPLAPSAASPMPAPPLPDEEAPPPARLRPKGLMTMRSLRLRSDDDNENGARVYMGATAQYSMGTDAQGNFVIAQGGHAGSPPLLALEKSTQRLFLRSRATQVRSLDVGAGGSIFVNGVSQWRILYAEDFDTPAGVAGWSRSAVTSCAGITMLGGFCQFSKGEVAKTFANLPRHSQLRIRATYHFIDRWIGEAGYLKVKVEGATQPIVVWNEQHQQAMSMNGLSVCGENTPEGKFAVPIDVTIPHTQGAVEVIFGSTMDDADPCDESWGVSAVEISIRD